MRARHRTLLEQVLYLYHHSRQGAGLAYGMNSGIWDVVLGTRDRQPEQMSPVSGQGG